jgi:hypothetical protein
LRFSVVDFVFEELNFLNEIEEQISKRKKAANLFIS